MQNIIDFPLARLPNSVASPLVFAALLDRAADGIGALHGCDGETQMFMRDCTLTDDNFVLKLVKTIGVDDMLGVSFYRFDDAAPDYYVKDFCLYVIYDGASIAEVFTEEFDPAPLPLRQLLHHSLSSALERLADGHARRHVH
jgi:hypothetical protein